MKKIMILATMLFAMQAQALTLDEPYANAVSSQVATNQVKNKGYSENKSNITGSQRKAPDSTSKTKTVKVNPVIETKFSKEVVQPINVSVGSLNSSVKGFGCEAPKVEKKIEPPKCDK